MESVGKGAFFGLICLTVTFAVIASQKPSLQLTHATLVTCGSDLDDDTDCRRPEAVGPALAARANPNGQVVEFLQKDRSPPLFLNTCKVLDQSDWVCTRPATAATAVVGMSNGRLYTVFTTADRGDLYHSSLTGWVNWAFTHRLITFNQALGLSNAAPWRSSARSPTEPIAVQGAVYAPLIIFYRHWVLWTAGAAVLFGFQFLLGMAEALGRIRSRTSPPIGR